MFAIKLLKNRKAYAGLCVRLFNNRKIFEEKSTKKSLKTDFETFLS
jgi:hypothetical protein